MDVDDSLNFSSFPAEADVSDLADAEDALALNFNWTVDQEILLFEAMMGHKPVGVNKNIHMMCIQRKMNLKWRLISKSAYITPKHIWTKLRSMYDLEALDESECVPFPEKTEDFVLPKEEFEKLMSDCPTNSNNTSRSSTVDREMDEESKNADNASKDDLTPEEPSTTESASATPAVPAGASTTSASADASSSATSISVAPTSTSSSTAATGSTAVSTPSGPSATSTPTSTKPGRKRSKANANQSETDKTPSGPSSAKRSRR